MSANGNSEAQTQRKRWVCGTCRNHSSEYERLGIGQCTGKPLTYYTVGRDKIPVCENGARFVLVDLGSRHQGILQDLTGIRGLAGRVKQALLTALANFKKERIARLSGDLNPNEYEAFIADSLAGWRFMVCVPFLTGGKEALEEMKSQIPEDSLNEILSLLEFGEQYLQTAELNPEELSRKDRMRRWGDAKNAFLFLVGNPSKRIPSLQERIRKAASMDRTAFRRDFAVRQFMGAFGINRVEAEKLVNEEFMTDVERTLQDREPTSEGDSASVPTEKSAPSITIEEIVTLPARVRVVKTGTSEKVRERASRFFQKYLGVDFPQLWWDPIETSASSPIDSDIANQIEEAARNGSSIRVIKDGKEIAPNATTE